MRTILATIAALGMLASPMIAAAEGAVPTAPAAQSSKPDAKAAKTPKTRNVHKTPVKHPQGTKKASGRTVRTSKTSTTKRQIKKTTPRSNSAATPAPAPATK